MTSMKNEQIRETVREQYGNTAGQCCGGPAPEDSNACCVKDAQAKVAGDVGCGCDPIPKDIAISNSNPCCSGGSDSVNELSQVLGYSSEELSSLPEGDVWTPHFNYQYAV